MRKNLYFINSLLAIEVGIFYLFQMLGKFFAPAMIFPKVNLPFLTLFSVMPMVVQSYIEPEIKRNSIISIVMAGVTFTILPMCAGIDLGVSAWKLLVGATLVYGATYGVYASMSQRMDSGAHTKFTPIVHGFLLFLASQCLQGIF